MTCAPAVLPQELIIQLAVGGNLCIPIGQEQQSLLLIHKNLDGSIENKNYYAGGICRNDQGWPLKVNTLRILLYTLL